MNILSRNQHADDLIEGRLTELDAIDAQLDEMFNVMRTETASTPLPEPNAALARILREGRVVAAAPVPARRRRRARLALTALFATAFLSTTAVAGALPAPIQRATADFVARFGLHIPGETQPSDRDQDAPSREPQAPAPSTTTPTPRTDTSTTGSGGQTSTTASGTHTSVTLPPLTPTTLPPVTVPTVPSLPTLPTLPPVTIPTIP